MQKGPSPTISFDITIQKRHTFPKCSAKLPAEHFFRDKAIKCPMDVVLARTDMRAFDGQRVIDHPGWEMLRSIGKSYSKT